jgi:8-oxo-dGTP diphosphatase
MANRTTAVELTNMIMIENAETGEVLVEDRRNPKWPGVTFPGGHVEAGETVTESVIREAREETGLTIANPILTGIKEWPISDGDRYVVFLYKATEYSGDIKSGAEGDIFWTTRDDLKNGVYQTPETFLEMLPVFDDDAVNELALGESEDGRPIRWQ